MEKIRKISRQIYNNEKILYEWDDWGIKTMCVSQGYIMDRLRRVKILTNASLEARAFKLHLEHKTNEKRALSILSS